MVHRILVLSLAASFAVATSASSDEPAVAAIEVGRLTVVPVGLEKDAGSVMIEICDSAVDFESEDVHFRGAIVKVENEQAVGVFEDVPNGVYAIKAFHDENGNRKLDTNSLGMPREKYGFSNDALGHFGPPGFEKASFRFEAEEATIGMR